MFTLLLKNPVDNLNPALCQLTLKCTVWKSLPLTQGGQDQSYQNDDFSIPIPKMFSIKFDQIISSVSLNWAGGTPRVAKSTLQLSLSLGELALQKYYGSAVIVR